MFITASNSFGNITSLLYLNFLCGLKLFEFLKNESLIIMKHLTSIISRFKRRGIVDIIFFMGTVLIVIGIISVFPFHYVGYTWFSFVIIGFGLILIFYGIIKYDFFCKNDPHLLMPPETQIQHRLVNLLGDSTHPDTVSEVTNAIKTISIDSKQKTIGGAHA